MIETTEKCDVCGKVVKAHTDDGWEGIRCDMVQPFTDKEGTRLEGYRTYHHASFRIREKRRTFSGYTSSPMPDFVMPEMTCSVACIEQAFLMWADKARFARNEPVK